MKYLIALLDRLRIAFTSYRFNSDYRIERATIDALYATYRSRIDTADESRCLWRAVCQYRSQASARSLMATVLANTVSLILLPLLLVLLRPAAPALDRKRACEYLKIDFHQAYQIPEQIRARTLEARAQRRYVTAADLAFAVKLFVRNRAPYPELFAKFVLWIASVRPVLDQFAVQYLIQYCEYSAYSSLRKLYLNSQGVLLANVTHGEELISCRSAFSTFDQYFAWELTPRYVHEAMRMEYATRFDFNPCAGLPPAPGVARPAVGILWPAIDDQELDRVVQVINELSTRYTVIVRVHPNPKYANHFGEFRRQLCAEESDARMEDIHTFINRTSVVVGYLSAVLLQAALRGRDVIYLRDEHLASLAEYHDYYRSVTAIDLPGLTSLLTSRLSGVVN